MGAHIVSGWSGPKGLPLAATAHPSIGLPPFRIQVLRLGVSSLRLNERPVLPWGQHMCCKVALSFGECVWNLPQRPIDQFMGEQAESETPCPVLVEMAGSPPPPKRGQGHAGAEEEVPGPLGEPVAGLLELAGGRRRDAQRRLLHGGSQGGRRNQGSEYSVLLGHRQPLAGRQTSLVASAPSPQTSGVARRPVKHTPISPCDREYGQQGVQVRAAEGDEQGRALGQASSSSPPRRGLHPQVL